MILKIASVSEEQSASSGQIASNVNAITGVTQETAKGTEQVARAAEDLNRLTANLQSLIGSFTLSAEEPTRQATAKHRLGSS
jgi:methyl-accepting chemotaxis protein